MGCTVFANDNGFFHKGSGGSGKAFPDVCLSPPPPPTGPVPVPYPNQLQASDLAEGSQTVKIQGEPTALEDSSYISTSTGDEGGTQGGGVITHKTKGKAYFKLWSFDVKVEGKGVDRHDDPMGQNCSSSPLNGFDAKCWVVASKAYNPRVKCAAKYPGHPGTTEKQRKAAQSAPLCWECHKPVNPPKAIADHQPPCLALWYAGLCHKPDVFKKWAHKPTSTKPHCPTCSLAQSRLMRNLYSVVLKAAHGL
jgi:hypothetical protein